MSIKEYKFYVNVTADPLYDDRTPIDLLVPSFFKKIAFLFIELLYPYADWNLYKTTVTF